MDLQTRKLNLIYFLAQLQDENLLVKFESFILNKKPSEKNEFLKQFTESELIARIEKPENDYRIENFKTQEELEKISENWKK